MTGDHSRSGRVADLAPMTPEERLDAIVMLLAIGVVRSTEKQGQEGAEDRAFGESLAAEVATLPGGLA